MPTCGTRHWPPRLVTVPGLYGSEEAHWQSWLERQFARSLRVQQANWDAPSLAQWSESVEALLSEERGPFVLAAHSYGCLVAAHAIRRRQAERNVVGVLFVAPASPAKFSSVGRFQAQRLGIPSILIGSQNDPWMPVTEARTLAQHLGSAFVDLGAAGHINTAAGFGPWPRAKYFIDTLIHCAAINVFGHAREEAVHQDG